MFVWCCIPAAKLTADALGVSGSTICSPAEAESSAAAGIVGTATCVFGMAGGMSCVAVGMSCVAKGTSCMAGDMSHADLVAGF